MNDFCGIVSWDWNWRHLVPPMWLVSTAYMTLLKRFLFGCLYGLVFSTAWFVVEGLYMVFEVSELPWWSFAFDAGVAAPLIFGVALAAGAVFSGWSSLTGKDDPVYEAIAALGRWSWRDTGEAQARRTAWLLGGAGLALVWLACGVWAGDKILGTIKTPEFAAALVLLVALGSAVLLAVGSAAIVAPLVKMLRWLAARGAERFIRAAYALGLMTAAGLGVVLVLWAKFPDVMPHLPWSFALAPIAGLFGVATVAHFSRPLSRQLPRAVIFAAIPLAILGILTTYMPPSLVDGRGVFVGRSTVAGVWYGVLDARLDHDGDGALHLYGGNDCAPRDASRHPSAREIVGNGVDENCSGADLTVSLEDFSTGKLRHRRPSGITKRPNIVLVTTDALSHRHTSVGGYKRDTTPNLAAWAKEATVFEHGFSLAPSTRLAMPGLVAGTFNSMVPMKNGRIYPYEYAKGVPTIASMLKKKGYKTVFVPGYKYFLPGRWRGYTQGFDVVDPDAYRKAKNKKHTGESVTDRALHYLRQQDNKPLFLWVHYYDHHSPYETPEGHEVFEVDQKVDRYDNELHFVDQQWGRLFEAVAKTWRPDEYLMAFTSDHGEAFDARHKRHHHGYSLDTEVLHVPFIIQGPRQRGKRIDGLVWHADFAPTFANLVGAEPAKSWLGESLVPSLFEGEAPEKDAIYSLFYVPEATKRDEDAFGRIGVRTDQYSFQQDMAKGKRLLFDWKKDPLGEEDLSAKMPDIFEAYRYLAAQKLKELRDKEKGLSHLKKAD